MIRFKMAYCFCKELLTNTYSTSLKLYAVFILMMSLGFSSYAQNTPKHSNKVFFSIHSNLLYDAALIPNVGAEIYLGKSLSLQANWNYAWWKSEKRNKFWQTYGGDITLRYWFGSTACNNPLTGQHIGIYGQALTYDFELNGHGYLELWRWHRVWFCITYITESQPRFLFRNRLSHWQVQEIQAHRYPLCMASH